MGFNQIVGQESIKMELINSVGHHVHFLLRGPSGCGKTVLAETLAQMLGPYDIQTVQTGKDLSFDPKAVTHIIDEAHLLKQPEVLFAEMEKARFIFCTTESGDLPETLTNRCICLTLNPYSIADLVQIGYGQYEYSVAVMTLLASRARETPRVMLQLCQRVQMNVPEPTYSTVKDFLEAVGVYDGGYTEDDRRYLAVLENLSRDGKGVGRDTLIAALHMSANIVIREIEPFLLRRNRIRITRSGRQLNHESSST